MSDRREGEFDLPGAHDAVFDALLREAAGGARAPDLTATVAERLRRVHRQRRAAALVGLLVGVAATLGIAWSLHFFAAAPRRPVVWRIAAGCLAWQSAGATTVAHAHERALWPLAPGDRLRTCADSAATADVAALGRLHMHRGTEIEVKTMEWKAFSGGAALGAVTVAVVVGALRWSGGGTSVDAHAGDTVELRADGAQVATARITELQNELANAQRQLEEANGRVRDLAAQAARTVAANAEAAAAQQPEPAPQPLQHAFTYAGLEAALAAVDWDVTGKCMHEMTGKLEQLMAALEAGEEVPLELAGEIQGLNAELVKLAGTLVKADVPGTGPNGAFTNPVVAANQIHATLAKAGTPLSSTQEDALRKLSSQIAGEDEARRAATPEGGYELEGILGETELKDRFYEGARGLLSPEQARLLFPDRLAGATANLFDTGLVWAQFARPMEVRDRGDFTGQVTRTVVDRLGLGSDADTQVRAVVAAWVERMPDDAFQVGDRWTRTGLGKLGGVRSAAQRQLELLRELDRLPLTAEQKRKLRAASPVFMPYRSK